MAKKTSVRRTVVMPDRHWPVHDKPANTCVFKACDLIRPYRVVDLGDFGECDSVSDYTWKHKRKPDFEWIRPAIDAEIVGLNGYLDYQDKRFKAAGVKEIVYLEGNHEERFDRLVERDPTLADVCNPMGTIGYGWSDILCLDKRGYTYLPYGQVYRIGKLRLYHGNFYGGVHHSKAHLLKMGVSVLYAHWHDVQQYSICHEDGAKSAWAIGCLKSLKPEDNDWLGGRPKNWAHAFAIVDEHDNGEFGVTVVWVINGRCVVDGVLIDGNKQTIKI